MENQKPNLGYREYSQEVIDSLSLKYKKQLEEQGLTKQEETIKALKETIKTSAKSLCEKTSVKCKITEEEIEVNW